MPDPSAKFEKPPLPPAIESPVLIGPSRSERLGYALGIDIGCEDTLLAVSREVRMPRSSVVITTAAREIIRLSKSGEKVESIAVLGSESDPTLHPDFREIVTNLRDLRNKWFPKSKLWLVADDPRFEGTESHLSLPIFDRIVVRHEWGTTKAFAALTGRKPGELATYQSGLGTHEFLVIQAAFYKAGADNSTDAEVKAWVRRLGEVRPREVHLLSADPRVSARKGKLVPKSRLEEIAATVTEKTGIPATVVGLAAFPA